MTQGWTDLATRLEAPKPSSGVETACQQGLAVGANPPTSPGGVCRGPRSSPALAPAKNGDRTLIIFWNRPHNGKDPPRASAHFHDDLTICVALRPSL